MVDEFPAAAVAAGVVVDLEGVPPEGDEPAGELLVVEDDVADEEHLVAGESPAGEGLHAETGVGPGGESVAVGGDAPGE